MNGEAFRNGPGTDRQPGRSSPLGRFLRAGLLPRVAVILVGVPCLYLITLRGGIFFPIVN